MKKSQQTQSSKATKLVFRREMQTIFAITLIAVMGVASLTPAFPRIKEVFNINNHQIGYLITVFTLPGIFLNPVLGILADRFGRKTILIPSLFLFAIAGVLCAFTRSYEVLLVFRFFQGMGAAALGSLNVTLIGDFFEGRERAEAMGTNAAVLSIGTALYPAIGGALAMLGWYYPFLFPILAVPVGLWVLSLKTPIASSGENLWMYLRGVSDYLVNRNVIALFLMSVFTFIILYGSYLTYLPLLLNDNFEAETWQIGLILSIGSITTAIISPYLGRLSTRFGYKGLLIFANLLFVVSLLIIPAIGFKWLMLLPAAIFGTAMGINMPALQTLLASSAPIHYRAAFMSVNGSVLRLGQTLGPVITAMAYTAFGMSAAFYTGVFAASIILALLLFLVKNLSVG